MGLLILSFFDFLTLAPKRERLNEFRKADGCFCRKQGINKITKAILERSATIGHIASELVDEQ